MLITIMPMISTAPTNQLTSPNKSKTTCDSKSWTKGTINTYSPTSWIKRSLDRD